LKTLRTLTGLALGIVLTVAVLLIATIEVLSRPASRFVGDAPPNLQANSVTLTTATNGRVTGWFVQGTPGMGAVLLLHGVRGDRRNMLERARLLKAANYSLMLIDLPAHGESTGARITFGWREADGVKTAFDYIRQKLPHERIGVIGVSLGAASLVLARIKPPPSAVVLESMYATIAEAVQNRLVMRLGRIGENIAPLLLQQFSFRLGITAEQLRPIAELSAIGAPVLVASGTADRHTTLEETRRIFAAATDPRELWTVEGAAHVDLQRYAPKAYEARVLPFLARYLRDGT